MIYISENKDNENVWFFPFLFEHIGILNLRFFVSSHSQVHTVLWVFWSAARRPSATSTTRDAGDVVTIYPAHELRSQQHYTHQD